MKKRLTIFLTAETFKVGILLQLLNPDVLPVYPFRDDGLLVYDATKTYVHDVLNKNYGTLLKETFVLN